MKSLHLSLDVKNFEKQKDKERGRSERGERESERGRKKDEPCVRGRH